MDDPPTAFSTFYEAIRRASQEHIRLKTEMASSNKASKPWWNAECAKRVAESRKAWNKYNQWPSPENRSALNRAIAVKKRTILKAQKEAWDAKLQSVGIANPSETWQFVNAMRNLPVKSLQSNDLRLPDGTKVSDPKEKAQLLVEVFSKHQQARWPHTRDQKNLVKTMNERINEAKREVNHLDKEIIVEEVIVAASELKPMTMGDDLVHNEMLQNLNYENAKLVTRLFNLSLNKSYIPKEWRRSTVCPILKPNKDPTDPESYRPIALTSCLGKLCEKIISRWLTWHLEEKRLIPENQAGFRRNRSTLDHILHLEAKIQEGFNIGLNTYAIFLVLCNAYDAAWHKAILFKLTEVEVRGKALCWIEAFLKKREMKVRVDGTTSEPVKITIGVPQGSVLSPLLFLVLTIDFPAPRKFTDSLIFADDIVILCRALSNRLGKIILQPYLKAVAKWAEKWRLKFSTTKSAAVVFSRHKRPLENPGFKLYSQPVKHQSTYKYLGVTFDTKLNWEAHVEEACRKADSNGRLLLYLCRGKTGPHIKTLVCVYKALVRSILDYASPVLLSAPKYTLRRMDVIQNKYARAILQAFKSTPIAQLLLETGIEPLSLRREYLASRYMAKVALNDELRET